MGRNKYKASFHCYHSVSWKKVLEVPFIFSLGEKQVLVAAILDRLFSCVFWVRNCLSSVHQLHSRAAAEPFQLWSWLVASSSLYLWMSESDSGKVLLWGLGKLIYQAQTPREMFIKQMCSFCLETCPAVPVLNIKNKLSCQGKNIMHNLILIFQYSVSIFWLEITKELLLNETVQISELVFLDNINWKNWLHSKALYLFLFWNGSICMYVLCFSFPPPLLTPKNFSS